MIADTQAREKLVAAWKRVRISLEMVRTNHAMAHFRGAPLTPDYTALAHNLVLVYAFAVFEGALEKLEEEGTLPPTKGGLKRLMAASQKFLPWQDFGAVDAGRDERNLVAHEGAALPPERCVHHIDAIERELVAWKVLPGPIKATYTISVGG